VKYGDRLHGDSEAPASASSLEEKGVGDHDKRSAEQACEVREIPSKA
jgi:hypothetical protein